jgi:outer membrane protein assembly factor BamD (BamD/ComL family)
MLIIIEVFAYYYKGEIDLAISELDTYIKRFPNHSFIPEAKQWREKLRKKYGK